MDDTGKFLDAIQQEVTLFDGVVILCVLCVRSDCFYDTTYCINSTVQSTQIDKARKLTEEMRKAKGSTSYASKCPSVTPKAFAMDLS